MSGSENLKLIGPGGYRLNKRRTPAGREDEKQSAFLQQNQVLWTAGVIAMCRLRHCEQSRTEAFATPYEGGNIRATQITIFRKL